MKVDLYAQAIFTSPPERLKDILPAGTSHEWLVAPCVDRPERNRDADPVQAGTGNLGKINLGLKHNFRFQYIDDFTMGGPLPGRLR